MFSGLFVSSVEPEYISFSKIPRKLHIMIDTWRRSLCTTAEKENFSSDSKWELHWMIIILSHLRNSDKTTIDCIWYLNNKLMQWN